VSGQRRILLVLAAGLWSATLAFALRAFTPERDAILPFSSDDAISVIMANEKRITPFHLFYFGQDRFGAWPHLALDLLSRFTGPITPSAFSHAQVIWAWLGAIPLWQLAGVHAPGVLVAYLWALALAPPLVVHLFSFQPYTWQLAALFWTWWAFRGLLAAPRRNAAIAALALIAAVLSVWTSRVSVSMVLALAAMEALRDRQTRGRFITRHLAPVALALVACFSEWALRTIHRQYSLKHVGAVFETPVRADSGFYLQNFGAALRRVWSLPPGVLSIVATTAGLAGLVVWGVAQRRRWRFAEWREAAIFGGAMSLLIALQLAVIVGTSWVRMNGYPARYFVFCSVLAALIVGAAVSAIVAAGIPRIHWMVLVAGAALFIAWRPATSPAADFLAARSAALSLAQAHPKPIIWGAYWSTYWLAGAAPEGGLRPVPFQGEVDRMPWLDRDLASADVVIGSFRATERFGDPANPTPLLVDRGEVLELAGTRIEGSLPFALYRRRTPARAEVHVEEPLDPGVSALFDGRFDTTFPLRQLTIRYHCPATSTLDVLGAEASVELSHSAHWVPLTATRRQRWTLPPREGDVRLRLEGRGPTSEVVVLCETPH
jgi:hypothetical protein